MPVFCGRNLFLSHITDIGLQLWLFMYYSMYYKMEDLNGIYTFARAYGIQSAGRFK